MTTHQLILNTINVYINPIKQKKQITSFLVTMSNTVNIRSLKRSKYSPTILEPSKCIRFLSPSPPHSPDANHNQQDRDPVEPPHVMFNEDADEIVDAESDLEFADDKDDTDNGEDDDNNDTDDGDNRQGDPDAEPCWKI